jgi:5-methylcytosine-specific restriction enzyme A
MPTIKYYCSAPNCFKEVDKKGRCDIHRRQSDKDYKRRHVEEEKERAKFYNSATWKKVRLLKLQLDPLCQHCKLAGIVTVADSVDHNVPWRNGGAKLDLNNLVSLCRAHHTIKSNKERKR